MSTNYQVVLVQRDLANAQNNELEAVLAYRKAVVDFERMQQTGTAGNITAFRDETPRGLSRSRHSSPCRTAGRRLAKARGLRERGGGGGRTDHPGRRGDRREVPAHQGSVPGDLELTDAGETRAVDAVRPQAGGGRIIGIFLDEFHVQAGDATLRARAAFNHLVDTLLRDGDSVALVKPLDPLHAITFTQDRALIRKVIAAFEGHAGDYTPRTEFERNFMSRDPKTAEATRAQVVSAALQSLARRLGEQQPGRKALIFVSEGFRPAQPRAIVYAANRNSVAFYPLDPHPEASDDESMLRSIAEQTGGAASINDADLAPAVAQAVADLDHYFVLSFSPSGPADGKFHPVQVRVKQPGAQARSRSGYWAPDARLAALPRRPRQRESGDLPGVTHRARTSVRGSACLEDPTD